MADGSNSTSIRSLVSGIRQARVVGGSDALPGEYCWQVSNGIKLNNCFPFQIDEERNSPLENL